MKRLLLFLSVASTGGILEAARGADDPVLAVKGGSVQLSVQAILAGMDIDYIVWRFNTERPVVKYSNESKNPLKVYKEYANRAAVDPETYNLLLSDLTELDNGTYSARIMDHHGYEKDVAKYALVVYEAVPDLHFNMMLLYFNSTEGYCNVSVTCSAEESYASYTCNSAGCIENQVIVLKPHLLMSVTGSGSIVVCNASNLVSAKSRWGRMSDVCTEELAYQYFKSLLGPTLIFLDIFAPVFLIYLILYFLLIRPKHIGDLKSMQLKNKSFLASVELVHVHEFEEVLKDPALPDYLKGAAIYSMSQGRTPALPKLGLKPEQLTDTDTLVRL